MPKPVNIVKSGPFWVAVAALLALAVYIFPAAAPLCNMWPACQKQVAQAAVESGTVSGSVVIDNVTTVSPPSPTEP